MTLGTLIIHVFLFVVSGAALNEAKVDGYDLLMAGNDARFDELLVRMDKVEARGTLLQAENEELKRRILYLETTVTEQQGEITNMKDAIKEQTEVNRQLNERLKEIEGTDRLVEQNRLSQRMSNTYNQINGLLKTQDESHPSSLLDQEAMNDSTPQKRMLETGVPRITRRENEASVAFFARLDNHINNPGVHQIIAFDHVVTNIGNGYNAHAGDFRAPVAGIYVFSTTLMSGSQSISYHFQVMHNAKTVSSIYIPHGGTASQEVVLQLNQGDDVAIHNIDGGQRVYGQGYSTFSGFLLQEDFSNTVVVGK